MHNSELLAKFFSFVIELVVISGMYSLVIAGRRQRHGLAVTRAGDRSHVTDTIHSWSQSHLTYRHLGILQPTGNNGPNVGNEFQRCVVTVILADSNFFKYC